MAKIAALVATMVLVVAGVLPAQMRPPTRVAAPPLTPALLPAPVGTAPSTGSFEAGVAANGTLLMPTGFGQWLWIDQNGVSGIAGAGTGGVNVGTPPAGQNVAMLRGQGSLYHPLSVTGAPLAPGTYRVRYQAAQRRQASGLDHQRLRVLLLNSTGNLEIDEHAIEVPGASTSNTTTYGEFVTRAFTIGTQVWFGLYFEGQDATWQHTVFLDDIRLETLRVWNDPNAWVPVGVPTATDEIDIGSGVAMAMTSPAVARSVFVKGQLVASDAACSLSTAWVLVLGTDAVFEVGRVDTPFLQTFTLALAPTDATENVMGMGTALLGAMDSGRIDLHGRPVVSWTRLAATVPASATSQMVVHGDTTGWNVNDEIVVAGSVGQDHPGYVERSEARRITAVLATTTSPPTTTFDTAPSGQPSGLFQEMHFGAANVQTITRPTGVPAQWTVEQRAEVGLLSHNVVVTGDPVNSYPKRGAHVMLMRCALCGSGVGGRGRFSNTEFRFMGQAKTLGRYPLHWHMQLDQGAGQFAKNCSVHHSSNRAITLHGSDFVTVEGNVAYQHVGHGIFLEDGSEQGNVIRGNLVMETVKPAPGAELLPSDNQFSQFQNQTPGMFWITNPNNVIEDNVATGSIGTAYWFIFPRRLLGLSYDWSHPTTGFQPYQSYLQPLLAPLGRPPYQQPLGSFKRNLAHGCMNGFDVNDSIWDTAFGPFLKDSIRTNIGWEPPTSPQVIEDFAAYGCDIGIYSGTSFDETLLYYMVYGLHPFDFTRAVLVDNVRATMLASYVTLQGSLFVANSGNGIQMNWARLALIYDGALRFADCHAVGFDVGAPTMIELSGAATLHANNAIQGLTRPAGGALLFNIQNCVPNPLTPPALPSASTQPIPSQWGVTMRDDGSVTGAAGTIVSNHPWMMSGIAGVETPLAATGNSNMLRTPVEFGLVSLEFPARWPPAPPGWTGALPVRLMPVPVAYVKRLARPLPPFGTVPAWTYLEDSATEHHRGMTVITDVPWLAPSVQYEYDFTPDLTTNPPVLGLPASGHLTVTLDDRAPGDVAWITVRGVPFNNLWLDDVTDVHATSGAPIPMTPVGSFTGVTGTAAMVDTTNRVISLRLEIPAAHRYTTVAVLWN